MFPIANPTGCAGINTDCCPCPIPETLHVTWTGATGAECIACGSGSFPITWVAPTLFVPIGFWTGSGVYCPPSPNSPLTIVVGFRCLSGNWQIRWQINFANGSGFCQTSDWSDISGTCSPFYFLRQEHSGGSPCCGGNDPATGFDLEITL